MKRTIKVATGIAALSGGLLFAATSAFGGANGGTVELFGTPGSTGNPDQIVLTGAIGDFGTATQTNSAGKPDPKGGYRLVTLSKGTLLINTKVFNGGNNAPPTTSNARTCSATFVQTGPVPVVSGTGAYSGISGKLTVTASFAIVFSSTNGKCNMSSTSAPLAQYGSLAGSGQVSF